MATLELNDPVAGELCRTIREMYGADAHLKVGQYEGRVVAMAADDHLVYRYQLGDSVLDACARLMTALQGRPVNVGGYRAQC